MPRLASITSRSLTAIATQPQELLPVYSISLDQSSYNEGDTVTATITALRVEDGVTVNYTVTGLSTGDITAGSLSGTATIASETATVTWTLAEDGLTEGADTFTFSLAAQDSAGNDTDFAAASATVNDTSFDPNATPWLDDTDTIVTVRSIIGSTSMTFNGAFATNPGVPIDIEGRITGTTTTITAITANTGTFFEVNDTGNSTQFQIGEEINLVL